MARQYVEQLTDDLDGGKADTTLRFSWENAAYEIDLSKKNAAAFAKLVKPYVDAGRKVRRSAGASGRRGGRRPGLGEGERLRRRRSRPHSGSGSRGLQSPLSPIPGCAISGRLSAAEVAQSGRE